MKYLILISMMAISLVGSDFLKNRDYIVDNQHNLYWQDTKDNISVLKSQESAVKYCENLTLNGYSNWQLPTREQYKYIIDKTRRDEKMINRTFRYILSDDYWTQDTRWQSLNKYGYYIFFKSGAIYYNNKSYPKYVRCVRLAI